MIIGVPKEIKPQESRIGLTPHSVKELIDCNHKVLIENNGGFEAGFDNSEYESAGAKVVNRSECLQSDICLCVRMPSQRDIVKMKKGC